MDGPNELFPVSLILANRRCLVVGGGRVAARKAAKLVSAGAQLTVVAPGITAQVRDLPGVRLVEEPFQEGMEEGFFLVFALTDDEALNRRIVERCHRKGILCSAADANWPGGDLILPASFSADGLTVSVSTSGRACRRSRLLRESLGRHVRFLRDIDLLIAGTDYRSGFPVMEKLKQRREAIERILDGIQGVHEFMILETCNRFEIIGLVSAGTDLNLFFTDLPPPLKGMDAFRHLAETAAGLHAQAFGETRIVAQIKTALADARQRGFAGGSLQRWTDTTLHISKEIRQLFDVRLPATETEDLVVDWLESRECVVGKILIIGRGEIGEALSRRFPDAVQIGGRSEHEIRHSLPEATLILCATGSRRFIIDEAHRSLLRSGAVLVDLASPRNINPELPGVVGLSDLRAGVAPEEREALLSRAGEIIERHRGEYERLVTFK